MDAPTMNTNRHILLAIATMAAAVSATPVYAKSGKFDTFTDGARTAKYEIYTTGKKSGKFDPYVDGAKAGKFDTYTDGARYYIASDRASL